MIRLGPLLDFSIGLQQYCVMKGPVCSTVRLLLDTASDAKGLWRRSWEYSLFMVRIITLVRAHDPDFESFLIIGRF